MNFVNMCVGCGEIFGCICNGEKNLCDYCEECVAGIQDCMITGGLCQNCFDFAMAKVEARRNGYVN